MFWIIHIIALLLFFPALLVTIPLHMIHSSVAKPSGISGWIEYKNCPDCKEQIKRNANICKHCGLRFDTIIDVKKSTYDTYKYDEKEARGYAALLNETISEYDKGETVEVNSNGYDKDGNYIPDSKEKEILASIGIKDNKKD